VDLTQSLLYPSQANDRTFKEDWLGAVADTSSWAAAKAKSQEALRDTKAQQQRLAAQVELLQQQAAAAEVQVERLGQEEEAWAAQRQLRLVSWLMLLRHIRIYRYRLQCTAGIKGAVWGLVGWQECRGSRKRS
jgi:hypothetical protein